MKDNHNKIVYSAEDLKTSPGIRRSLDRLVSLRRLRMTILVSQRLTCDAAPEIFMTDRPSRSRVSARKTVHYRAMRRKRNILVNHLSKVASVSYRLNIVPNLLDEEIS